MTINNKQAICNPDLCFSDNRNSFLPPSSPNVVGKKRARPVNSSSSHNFGKKPKTQVSQAQAPVNLDDSQIEAKSMECGDSITNELQSKVSSQRIWDHGTNIHNDVESDFVQPCRPSKSTKIFAVKAAMGMGKTTQLRQYILDHPDASFLVVSSRISLSHSQQGQLPDFHHYSERNWSSRRLICQYESLHNVSQFYDYIILDEVRSVLSCMTSLKTNGVHIRTNANVLRKLILEAKLTIALDADLEVDKAVPYFFSTLFKSKSIQVVRYEKTRINRTLRFTKDETLFFREVNSALLSGKKVAIGCQSKKRALM